MTPLQARTPAPTDSLPGADADVPAGTASDVAPTADSAAVATVVTPDSLLVAADSAGGVAVQALPGDDYTLWYRRIAAETSGEAERFPLPTASVHYRTADADEVFGSLSRTVPPHISELRTQHSLTDNAGFQALVLLLSAVYGVLLSRRLQDIPLPGPLARNRASAERLVDDPPGNNIGRLRSFAALLGLCLVGMAAVRSVDLLRPGIMPDALPAFLSPFAGSALWIGATLVMALIGGYQAMVLILAGALTLTRPFVGQLLHLRRRLFASLLLVFAPSLLFFTAAPPGTERFWGIVAVAVSLVTSVVYVVGSLHLFLSKKISILYWFLYLCTVEIFPLSLLWLLAGRGL